MSYNKNSGKGGQGGLCRTVTSHHNMAPVAMYGGAREVVTAHNGVTSRSSSGVTRNGSNQARNVVTYHKSVTTQKSAVAPSGTKIQTSVTTKSSVTVRTTITAPAGGSKSVVQSGKR